MDINSLYHQSLNSSTDAENQLFKKLTARFLYVTKRKVRDKDDAEDIVQNTLEVIARKYRNMIFEKSFSAWVYKVLSLNILQYYKQQGKIQNISNIDNFFNFEDYNNSPSDYIEKLRSCFRKICVSNNRYARILNLTHQGYKVDEICSKLSITKQNAYSTLSRARSLLTSCIEKGNLKNA